MSKSFSDLGMHQSFQQRQQEEVPDITGFEQELGITFSEFEKVDAQSITENNGVFMGEKI